MKDGRSGQRGGVVEGKGVGMDEWGGRGVGGRGGGREG